MITPDIVAKHFRCPSCRHPRLETVVFASNGTRVKHGVLACPKCSIWYRVENELAELLVPSLRDRRQESAFVRRFRSCWDGWKLPLETSPSGGTAHKLEQKSFYDRDAAAYETSMLQLPFWKAVDANSIDFVRSLEPAGKTLLEVGCGTGRLSIPTTGRFASVLAFDISETMVRTAIEKHGQSGEVECDFVYFVADAENIPIRDDGVDVALLYGILHHVEAPLVVLSETARCLRPGSSLFGCENNRSAFRPAFDLLMKAAKLWNEKAHDEHFVISHEALTSWLNEAGISGRCWTSVFAPPHLYNLFSAENARKLLRLTDKLCGMLPWYRWQGGLLMFTGRKNP